VSSDNSTLDAAHWPIKEVDFWACYGLAMMLNMDRARFEENMRACLASDQSPYRIFSSMYRYKMERSPTAAELSGSLQPD
jgi:hypothetical protein